MIKKRHYNFDLLRIIACFMVVVIHVAAYNWEYVNYNSFTFNVYNFYDSLVRAAVPLFVMISGVFFLNKDNINIKTLYKKNIFKLICFYLLWSCIYYVFDCYNYNQQFSILNFLTKLINGHYHLWFIPMILGLYVISPLLVKIARKSDKKLFKYFLIIFLCSCIVKTISYCEFLPKFYLITNVINKLPIDIICQYYSYFLLGYFLFKYDIDSKIRKVFYILGIISVFMCFGGTWYLSNYSGYNNSSFYGYFNIFTLLEAIAIFLVIKNLKIKMNKSKKILEYLSGCTLGIYAIHVLIMNLLFKFNIIIVTTFNPIISVVLISIIVFLLSFVCTYLLKKIPIINKYIA